MAAKKKGKCSKLAKMSEEEKLRYLQHRAAIEEEAKRRKEQLIAVYMKNKLKHEEAFIRLNSAKINQQWRHILRKVKCSELNSDMEALWSYFELTVNHKDKLIDTLLMDLEDADVQYSTAFKSHMEVVDQLIDLHKERLNSLHKSYWSKRETILNEAYIEKNELKFSGKKGCEHLQTVIYGMKCRTDERHKSATKRAVAKQDELRNQMLSDIEKVEDDGSSKMESIWSEMQQIFVDYLAEISPMRPHYNALLNKDKINSSDLWQHRHTVNKYIDLILTLKDKLSIIQQRHEVKINELRNEHKEFITKFDQLRMSVNQGQLKDQAQLQHLAVTNEHVIKYLTNLMQKGESILQLTSTCEKLLSEEEKLTNYRYLSKPIEDNTEKIQFPMPFQLTEKFWCKYNEAVLEYGAIYAQREAYIAENKQLKQILSHYLNTMVQPCSIARCP